MSIQQYQAVEQVRDRIDEPAPAFYSNPEIRRWINDAVREIARRAEWKKSSTTEAVVVGDQDLELATDIIRIYRVEFTPTGTSLKYPLSFYDINDLDIIWGPNQSVSSGIPEIYTLKGANPYTLTLAPKSSQAGTLTIFYFAMPTDLATNSNSAATTALDIPEGWEDLVIEYATAMAFRKARDTSMYALTMQEFNNKITELVEAFQRGSIDNAHVMPHAGAGWGFGWLDGYGY